MARSFQIVVAALPPASGRERIVRVKQAVRKHDIILSATTSVQRAEDAAKLFLRLAD